VWEAFGEVVFERAGGSERFRRRKAIFRHKVSFLCRVSRAAR
jgi:hypothetical protein